MNDRKKMKKLKFKNSKKKPVPTLEWLLRTAIVIFKNRKETNVKQTKKHKINLLKYTQKIYRIKP